MAFKVNKEFESKGELKQFLEPGIYEKGRIILAEKGRKAIYGSDDEFQPTIDIVFSSSDGKKHRDQGVKPKTEDAEEAFTERYLHILSSVCKTDAEIEELKAELENGPEDFEEFVDWAVVKINEKAKNNLVDFKVIGSVYNENTFTKMPNFNRKYAVPFITKHGTGKLVFSKQERQGNADYYAALSSASTGSAEGAVSSGSPAPVPGGAERPPF